MDNNEIDLIDLCEFIARKWRTILCFTLIGFIGGIIFAVLIGVYNKSQANKEIRYKTATTTLLEAEKEIEKENNSDEIKNYIDNNIINYQHLESQYDLQKEYTENSIYYNLDPENVYSIKLNYYIDNYYSVTYPEIEGYNNISDIITYYNSKILSNEVCEEIINQVYIGSEYQYIKELISIENPSTGNVRINIIADNEENAEKISSIIKANIELITKEIIELYGDMSCEFRFEEKNYESNLGVASNHSEKAKLLTGYYDDMQKIISSMKGAQLNYFKAKLQMVILDRTNDLKERPLSDYISKKKIALAAFLGMIAPIIAYACAYIFNGSIKTKHDLENMTKSIHIGSVEKDDNKKSGAIDKLIDRIFHKNRDNLDSEKAIELIANIIVETMKSKEVSDLCIVSSQSLGDNNSINKLHEAIANKGISTSLADEFLTNVNALSLVNSAKRIVVCEKLQKSTYSDLQKMLKLIKMNNDNIFGCITF